MGARKKIIFTADDFGMSESYDNAVLKAFLEGFLTSTCICANGNSYENAMKNVLPKCQKEGRKIDLGIHLNIVEGKSLTSCKYLTDKTGNFKLGFISLLMNSFNKKFMQEVEEEFRAQITRVIKDANYENFGVSHINSHVHIHGIPNIFKLCTQLAKEYNIPFIRTQNEHLYKAKKPPKLINLIKVAVLKFFTLNNKAKLTNKYVIGVGYTDEMDSNAILEGIKNIPSRNCIVEIITHLDSNPNNKSRFLQYQTALDLNLKKELEAINAEFISISDLD